MNPPLFRLPLFLLLIVVAMVSASPLFAVTYTFTGTGNPSLWSGSTSFSPNGTPGSGDIITLNSSTAGASLGVDGTTRTILNMDNSLATLNQSVIGAGTPATLNITGTLSKNNSGPSASLTLRDSGANTLSLFVNQIEYTGAGNFAFGSSITNALTAFSATTVNVNAASGLMLITMVNGGTAYFQNLNVTAGEVVLRNATTGTSTLVVNNLNGAGGAVKASNSQVGSTTFLVLGSSATNTYSGGLINGVAGSLLNVSKENTGIQVLAGVNTYTGNTTINNGTLRATIGTGTTGALGFGGGVRVGEAVGATTVNSGTLDLSGNITVNEVTTLNGGSLINSTAGSTATLNNGIASLQYTSSGTGTAGALTISGGGGAGAAGSATVATGTITSITLSNAGSGYTDAGSISVTRAGSGGGFAASAVLSSLTLTGTNNTIGGNGNLNIAAKVGGSGGFSKIGTGTLTLSASNSYSARTNITAGTLLITNSAGLGGGAAHLQGGALRVNAAAGVTNVVTFESVSSSYLLDRTIGQSYSVYAASSDLAGGIDTTASILSGTAGGTRVLTTGFATTSVASNDASRISDVFSLDGTTTDLFVMQLDISSSIGASSLIASLSGGAWVNTVSLNTGNNASGAQQGYQGAFSTFQGTYGFTLSNYVGAYGVDASNGTAWAVINHNSEFAIIPEPGTVGLLALGLGALLIRARRRQAKLS